MFSPCVTQVDVHGTGLSIELSQYASSPTLREAAFLLSPIMECFSSSNPDVWQLFDRCLPTQRVGTRTPNGFSCLVSSGRLDPAYQGSHPYAAQRGRLAARAKLRRTDVRSRQFAVACQLCELGRESERILVVAEQSRMVIGDIQLRIVPNQMFGNSRSCQTLTSNARQRALTSSRKDAQRGSVQHPETRNSRKLPPLGPNHHASSSSWETRINRAFSRS